MRPRALRLVKNCYVLNLTETSLLHFYGLFGINFENAVLYGILVSWLIIINVIILSEAPFVLDSREDEGGDAVAPIFAQRNGKITELR